MADTNYRLVEYTFPPTLRSRPMPTPPTMVIAPVVVLVELVVFKNNTRFVVVFPRVVTVCNVEVLLIRIIFPPTCVRLISGPALNESLKLAVVKTKPPPAYNAPPIHKFPPIPTPPLTIKAPVVGLRETVDDVTFNVANVPDVALMVPALIDPPADPWPAADTLRLPPTFKLPPIPTPPGVIIAPVVVLVDCVLVVTTKLFVTVRIGIV